MKRQQERIEQTGKEVGDKIEEAKTQEEKRAQADKASGSSRSFDLAPPPYEPPILEDVAMTAEAQESTQERE